MGELAGLVVARELAGLVVVGELAGLVVGRLSQGLQQAYVFGELAGLVVGCTPCKTTPATTMDVDTGSCNYLPLPSILINRQFNSRATGENNIDH